MVEILYFLLYYLLWGLCLFPSFYILCVLLGLTDREHGGDDK